MSSKFYNLYRYMGGDIVSLHEWLKRLRERYVRETMMTLADAREQLFIDQQGIRRLVEHDTQLGVRSPFNIDASACIYFHEERIYIQFFGVSETLYEPASFLVDCHYQNSTNRPDTVSEAEWEERYRITNELFGNDSRPSRNGLVFIFADEHDIFSLCMSCVLRIEP